MWQHAVMYCTRISSCCFLERKRFTDALLERLVPRDSLNISEAAVCLEKVGTLVCRNEQKLIAKTELCQLNEKTLTVLMLNFVANSPLTSISPWFSFLACLGWKTTTIYVWIPLGYHSQATDVTGHNCSLLLKAKYSHSVSTLHLNLVAALQLIREAMDVGMQVMKRDFCSLCTAEYTCVPMLPAYLWKDNSNSKIKKPYPSNFSRAAPASFFSSSAPYLNLLLQKKYF